MQRLHILGVTGYAILFIFSASMIQSRLQTPIDIFATLCVLTGLASFAVYFARETAIDESEQHKKQRRIRQVAHVGLLVFLVLTTTHFSNVIFTPYDSIGVLAHALILFAITYDHWTVPGMVALCVYLVLAAISSFGTGGIYILRGIACAMLLVPYGHIILADPVVKKIWQ